MSGSLVSKILKSLMFKKNINTSQLARDLNLPQQTLQRIVSGTSPNPHQKTLKPIADFFNLSVDQLKGASPLPKTHITTDLPTVQNNQARHIPVIDFSDILQYIEKPEDNPLETITIDRDDEDSDFATLLPDMSMSPYFPKGSILLLSLNKTVTDHCYALIKLNNPDVIIFRQLIFDGNDKYLKAMNPDLEKFPLKLLDSEDKIIGILTELRHKY